MSPFAQMLGTAGFALTVFFVAEVEAQEEFPAGLELAIRSVVRQQSYDLIRAMGPCEGLDAAWVAPNPGRGMRTLLGARGIIVLPAGSAEEEWRLGLSLERYGRSGDLRPVREAELAMEENRAEYRRGELVEWYVNDERGLEQGFTIPAPPETQATSESAAPLELRLAFETDLTAERSGDGRAIRFCDREGRVVLHYAGLAAWDTNGRVLAASLHLDGSELSIHVSDDGAVYPVTVDPVCFVEEARLEASDEANGDMFGRSVSVSGDTALVGASHDDDQGTSSGSAYVFVRSGPTWIQQGAKLKANDGAAGDEFGKSVALDGDTAVIAGGGAAYVFVRSGTSWSQRAKLVGSGGEDIGTSVAISGDTVVVGGANDWFSGEAAYVFVRSGSTWSEEARLVASDGGSLSHAVSISGDTAVFGDPDNDESEVSAGAVYVFARTGTIWSEEEKLLADDAAPSDNLGTSVSVSGDTVVAVSPVDDNPSHPNPGSVYVFVRTNGTVWSRQAEIPASYALAVSLSGDIAVAGAAPSGLVGSVYVFMRSGTTWSQVADFDGQLGEQFGYSVSVSGPTVVVGAPYWNSYGSGFGTAYVYGPGLHSGAMYCTCPLGPCGNSDSDAGCANATGGGAQLTAQGTTLPDVLNLLVSGAPPGQPAIFFQGNNAVMIPFGDGFRCAGGGIVRITTPPIVTEPDGTAAYGPCFGDPTISSVTGVVPGSGVTKRYQFWYRDPFGICGQHFNLSNGYEITW